MSKSAKGGGGNERSWESFRSLQRGRIKGMGAGFRRFSLSLSLCSGGCNNKLPVPLWSLVSNEAHPSFALAAVILPRLSSRLANFGGPPGGWGGGGFLSRTVGIRAKEITLHLQSSLFLSTLAKKKKRIFAVFHNKFYHLHHCIDCTARREIISRWFFLRFFFIFS